MINAELRSCILEKLRKLKIFYFSRQSEIFDFVENHQHLISKIVNLKSYIFLNVTLQTDTI